MAWQPYPSYRTAKVRWLPPIPEHWREQRAKTFFREVDERSEAGTEGLLSVSYLTGVAPREEEKRGMFKAESYIGSKLCQPDDIVINTMCAWMSALGVSRHSGIVSPAYGVYRAHDKNSFNFAYLDYLLRTSAYAAEYTTRSTGIQASRLRLYPNQFLDIPLLCPPLDEQNRIAAWLRAQDARIARYIQQRRALVGLLAERRSYFLQKAIESVETQHMRLSSLVAFASEPITRVAWEDYTPIGMFNRGRGIFHKPKTKGADLGDSTFFAIESGDFIFSGQFAWEGAVAVASPEEAGCVASHRYPIARCKLDIILPEYLYSFFTSKLGDMLLNHHSRGAAGRNRPLNPRTLAKEKIPVPPLQLQQEIADLFHQEQAARKEVEKEIALVLEYRQRQISDAVTGQIDLRGWQPGPGDVVDDALLSALGDENEDVTEEEDENGEY